MSSHELWNELGNLYFMSGAYNQAIHAYRRSIQMNSEFGRPYSNLALVYVQQGKLEEAIRLYRLGIDLLDDDKEKAITWSRLGNTLRHLKNYREAILAYQRADELDPDGGENRDEPGQGLYTPSDPSFPLDDLIKESVRANIEHQPDAVTTFVPDNSVNEDVMDAESIPWTQEDSIPPEPMTSAVTASDSSEIEAEFDNLDYIEDANLIILDKPATELRVADLDQNSLQDWQIVIPAVEPFNNEDSAESLDDMMQTTLSLDPESQMYQQKIEQPRSIPSFAVNNENKRLLNSEKIARQTAVSVEELPLNTFNIFDQFEPEPANIEVGPRVDYADVQPSKGREKTETEKAEKEIEKLKRIVQINSHNGFAWDTLGNLYKSLGMFQDAIVAYQQAIATNPLNAYYYHHMGLAYAAEGRDEDAVGAFQRVVEIDPDHSLAHATLGGYYRKMGFEELAQQHIGKAMKYIFDSENEYNRACMEAICGNTDQAIELLQVALANKQTYVDWVLRDPDLDFIRQDPRFKQLISDFTR